MARALAQTGAQTAGGGHRRCGGGRAANASAPVDYEAFIAGGDPAFPVALPDDEWQAIALNYTSGTTGNPKGVVLHHRGAYLNAVGNALTFGLSPRCVYLWTLPMFHCDGWTYTWAVTLAGGTHVCLRRVDPAPIFAAIAEHGVTHMCGAPVVLSMLIHAPADVRAAVRSDGADRHRRRGAALHGDRADGGDGVRGDASLRPDGKLRPVHRVHVAAGAGRDGDGGQGARSWRARG